MTRTTPELASLFHSSAPYQRLSSIPVDSSPPPWVGRWTWVPHIPPTYDLTRNRPNTRRSSVKSGFEAGTLRHLTTRPPRPSKTPGKIK
ncbi:hypothetical protein AVEN_194986-1 [Araneus ventricosus]|uniref:Uncharacterized protein n=1 Tax=Araneus ventricosus TaxID=182803 RepID=A0A4Y2QPI4_ARAVE|nr:hypothetical protein AVEN_194986-1 [Araneus ventricosus]